MKLVRTAVVAAVNQQQGTPEEFLERVVVWPDANQPGYINLHVNSKNTDPNKNGGKPWVIGWPMTTAADLLSHAAWCAMTDCFKNAWFCTSLQSDVGKTAKGKPKAVRKAANALALKARSGSIVTSSPSRQTGTLSIPEKRGPITKRSTRRGRPSARSRPRSASLFPLPW